VGLALKACTDSGRESPSGSDSRSSVRCVACMCCQTACPANGIHIEAEDIGDKGCEKRPRIFEIDLLLCVYCGNCVEAFPCDAIRMDTGIHAPPTLTRAEHLMTLACLLAAGGPSVAVQGGKLR